MKSLFKQRYICCLTNKLVKRCNIYTEVGCLGNFGFPGGFYVYVGSAQNNLKTV